MLATDVAIDAPGTNVRLRRYRRGDVAGLQRAANDIRVARYMFAGFPHPYTIADARSWIDLVLAREPPEHLVIDVDGTFAGSIGVMPRGAGYVGVGILGYWLAPAFWGRGITSAAVRIVVEHAFAHTFRRLEATVYDPNVASARVLEKNGFQLEGRLRRCRTGRDGLIMDELLYGRLRET